MEGVIDHTMRDLLTQLGGIDRCVTEFLRISQELLPPRVFHRICPELAQGGRTPSGVPVYLQILGGDPNLVAENAARAAELGAVGVDLNFGCPAKTVNRSDGGSIILRQPERVHSIVAATRRAMPDSVPLSVKIRLGFDNSDSFLDIVSGIDAAKPSEIVIHARTRSDGYRPPAYWEHIALARSVTQLPLIANGEIWGVGDARLAREKSNTPDLMLGRGVLCRPDLPRLIRAADEGTEQPALSWDEIRGYLIKYLAITMETYDARYAVNPIKQWLGYLRHYYPQAAAMFAVIKRILDPELLRLAIAGDDDPARLAA
ncbi:tRNA dihydrouridine synthase [Congregibacter sp.]|uniref:tRNA dihydrouridine synthase n=1 Tax=Congregibacter sp. TaxID=2744308 RepID=UPI00385B84F7